MSGLVQNADYKLCLRDQWRDAQAKHFQDLFKDYKDRLTTGIPENEVVKTLAHQIALEELLKDHPDILNSLPNGTLSELAAGMPASPDKDILRKIYSNYEIESDHSYQVWETGKRIELLKTLRDDPLVRNAREKWQDPGLDHDQKLRLAERVGEIQAKIYGYYPGVVMAYGHDDGSEAYYLAETIFLNTAQTEAGYNPRSFNGDFNDFLDTVTHENIHGLEDRAARNFKAARVEEENWLSARKLDAANLTPQTSMQFKKHMADWMDKNLAGGSQNVLNQALLPDGRLRDFAMMMTALQDRDHVLNVDLDGQEAYRANPDEKHSWDLAGTVNEYFKANNAVARNEILARLDERFRREYGFETAQCKGGPPVTFLEVPVRPVAPALQPEN